MKALFTSISVLVAGSVLAGNYTISNPWSGVAGDKANFAAFAFQANAGLYNDPTNNSINPPGSLTTTFTIDRLSLIRPNDTTTPNFGTAVGYLTDANTPVYVDIYTGGYSSGAFSGYVGSSYSGVKWSDTVAGQPYGFDFMGITLDSSTKYWFVFSEDAIDGEISQFRAYVNTSGNNTTPGAGQGYLVNDLVQVYTAPALATRDWGVAYVVNVPEPSIFALAGLGLGLLMLRSPSRRP